MAVATFPFELTDEVNLIVVIASIDGYKVRLALDTGASNTIINLTALLIVGYRIGQETGEVELETGKGIIKANTYTVKSLETLGIKKDQLPSLHVLSLPPFVSQFELEPMQPAGIRPVS